MKSGSIFLGLLPWFGFSLVAERAGADHVALAAAIAAGLAFVLMIIEVVRTGSLKILDATGVVLFGAITVIAVQGGHAVDTDLVNYGRGAVTWVLAAVMAVSAFTVPFTEQYARSTVDRSLWHSPVFRAKNRAISLMWAGVVFVIGCSHMVAGLVGVTSHGGPGNAILNWVIPIIAIVFAVKRTTAIADAGTARAAAPGATAQDR